MKTAIPIAQLLRWRLALAEAEAPPAPGATRLLELVRPWWEVLPERFEKLIQRLGAIEVAYGHAMAEPSPARPCHRVAVLIARASEESESSARVLYLAVRDRRLRLRFHLEKAPANLPPTVEVTFISEQSGQPLFCAPAAVSVDSEYRLEADLSAELARDWEQLKVMDRMPFRFIVRADTTS
ncbi:MAG TPA: hypothetical protein VK615_05260 [Candidatus Binatia bacterium]|nr:hypothetical protein [Candidatus Binatia bacterium]